MSRFGRPALVLAGAAEGLGASIAKMFAAAGHDVLGIARSDRATARLTELVGEAGGEYSHLACDVTQPTQVADALRPHADRIAVLVHNAHMLLIKPFEETSPAEFEEVWRVACLGAFVVAHAVLPQMRTRHAGTIILSGATAARRGGANFAAFASAKFALRGLAQSMSREYGPHGVHVAHVLIDGLIDAPQSDRRFGQAQSTRMDRSAFERTQGCRKTVHHHVVRQHKEMAGG
jgi:NAD(P)-dependent dehydrogenase (short-subunit alcohol dehydrogenase family)